MTRLKKRSFCEGNAELFYRAGSEEADEFHPQVNLCKGCGAVEVTDSDKCARCTTEDDVFLQQVMRELTG